MKRTAGLGLVGILAICGCGEEGINRDIEHRLSIASGAYGQTTSLDDVGTDDEVEYHSMELSVFSSAEPDVALQTIRSNNEGFYEFALPPGDYRICTYFDRCTAFSVGVAQCVRLDYEFSVGPGWADSSTITCPE